MLDIDKLCPPFSRYPTYHALDWAEGKTDDEVRAEIAAVEAKFSHTYKRNEVGCRQWDYVRVEVLKLVLADRASNTVTSEAA